MNKIRYKLTLAFIFTTLTISLLYGVLIFLAMEYTEDDILNRRLNLELNDYLNQIEQNGIDQAQLPKASGLNSYLASSADIPAWVASQPLGSRELHDREVHVGVFELPHSHDRLYILLDELKISNLENEIPTLVIILGSLATGITFIGLMIGLFFSRQIARPIQALTKDIEDNGLHQPPPFFGHQRDDEIGALSRAFSQLVTRLEGFIARERKFTQYVSHEFRTPISLLKNALAVLHLPEQTEPRRQRNLLRIESATLEMENLINTFLNLSREDMQLHQESINISTLLHDILQRNESIYDTRRLQITLNKEHDLIVVSDPNILSILIDNVIRNIFIHADSKATITLQKNRLIFDNDLRQSTETIEIKRESQGIEIIRQLSEKLGVDIETELTKDQYRLSIYC